MEKDSRGNPKSNPPNQLLSHFGRKAVPLRTKGCHTSAKGQLWQSG